MSPSLLITLSPLQAEEETRVEIQKDAVIPTYPTVDNPALAPEICVVDKTHGDGPPGPGGGAANTPEPLLGSVAHPELEGSPGLSLQRHLGCLATPTTPFLNCPGHP